MDKNSHEIPVSEDLDYKIRPYNLIQQEYEAHEKFAYSTDILGLEGTGDEVIHVWLLNLLLWQFS